jgi:K(+)-stimulated pyrophosphate-energized sodium pump
MNLLLIIVIFAAVLALAFAAFNFAKVKKMPEGTEQMSKIASAIRIGANAFINYEYKVLAIVIAIVAVVVIGGAAVAVILVNKKKTK